MMLQTALKLPFFEKFCPLNVKESAEDLDDRKNIWQAAGEI